MFRQLALITSLLWPALASADWYQSQGSAVIVKGDQASARNKAIENALKKTLLVAGASVSSVQQVVNGLLTKDEMNIRATGLVNAFELVEENFTDNLVTVIIRADIVPQEKQCYSADFKKSLLLTKSHIVNREQANLGQIYDLDSEIIRRLDKKLLNKAHYFSTKSNFKNKTKFSRLYQSNQAEQIKELTLTLSDFSDSQFVMYSEIEDLSFDDEVENSWKFWQEEIRNRHFTFSVFIYDGLSGEAVFEKQYNTIAPWTYSYRDAVDVRGNTFWQKPYGSQINQLLSDVALDLDEQLMCQPTFGKIVAIEGQDLLINIGRKHGVKVGDEFTLLHSSNFTTLSGKLYAGFNISPFKVKVTKTTINSANVSAVNGEQLGNIQINDLAVRK